jgi:hypothetical protein
MTGLSISKRDVSNLDPLKCPSNQKLQQKSKKSLSGKQRNNHQTHSERAFEGICWIIWGSIVLHNIEENHKHSIQTDVFVKMTCCLPEAM